MIFYPALLIFNVLFSFKTSHATINSACTDTDSGETWIRPYVGKDSDGLAYPNIKVRCFDGWTILDPSITDTKYQNNYSPYFSSYAYWTDTVISSSLDDHVSWKEWWTPADDDTKFRISPDCQSCVNSEEVDTTDYSTYYMTGSFVGCLWLTKGYCDMDSVTGECFKCAAPGFDEIISGICSHMEMPADHAVNTLHEECVETSYNSEPSLGGGGTYCVCYKPSTIEVRKPADFIDNPEEETVVSNTKDTRVELYATDFESGTYKISEPGYYIIMEDIDFNMNAPSDATFPNAPGAWMPREEQAEKYDGADGSFVGAYSMGFFAGITIESDDVTIDLNEHELRMGDQFYLQQRWFAIIELGTKAFVSGQGPGNFGYHMYSPQRVTIKNGIIGRSSHHGIHGNGATDLTIQNVHIKDFEVGGIALNGFTSALIENVEIGPVAMQIPTMGVFVQARIILDRLRAMYDEDPDLTVRFGERNKEYTALEIEQRLEEQMDIIYKKIIGGKSWDELSEEYDKATVYDAKKTFYNHAGLPSASTIYGMFLNSEGASVFAIGGAPGTSTGAIIKNVYIHDLVNDPWEVPRAVLTKGPFNDIMDLTRHTDNGMNLLETVKYVGSAYTDAQYTIATIGTAWSVLGHSVMQDPVIAWIENGGALGRVKMRCNNDIMLHVTKGIFGFRADSVTNMEIDGLKIENIHNVGVLGSYVCGNWESENDGGHRNQNYPMQRGYTGTETHAMSFVKSDGIIKNVDISKIFSARGDAMGLQFFPGNTFKVGNVFISDVHAGAYLKTDALPTNHLPNKIPRACAVSHWNWVGEDKGFYANNIAVDVNMINAACVTGHVKCDDSEFDNELAKTTECTTDHVFKHGNIKEPSEVYKTIANSFENRIYNKLYDMLQYQDKMEAANAKKYAEAIKNSGFKKKKSLKNKSTDEDEDEDEDTTDDSSDSDSDTSLEDESVLTEHHSVNPMTWEIEYEPSSNANANSNESMVKSSNATATNTNWMYLFMIIGALIILGLAIIVTKCKQNSKVTKTKEGLASELEPLAIGPRREYISLG